MVYQAELVGFFRTVLIIILVIYAFRLLSRFLLPFLLKYLSKKATKNFEQQFKQRQGYREENVKSKQGDVKVTYQNKTKNPKKDGFDGGEYIDYEEVE